MTPEDETRAMNVYLPRMHEIVTRLEILNAIGKNSLGFEAAYVREICYLQFRAICELIAIGCIAIYGDKNTSKKLLDTYEASKIITELKKLAPDCYPKPMSMNGSNISFKGPYSVQLSRSDLVTLWGKSGDVLHRSPFSKITNPKKQQKPVDLSDIPQWAEKITGLLKSHYIILSKTPESAKLMLVHLKEGATGLPAASFLDLSLTKRTANVSIHRLEKPHTRNR